MFQGYESLFFERVQKYKSDAIGYEEIIVNQGQRIKKNKLTKCSSAEI